MHFMLFRKHYRFLGKNLMFEIFTSVHNCCCLRICELKYLARREAPLVTDPSTTKLNWTSFSPPIYIVITVEPILPFWNPVGNNVLKKGDNMSMIQPTRSNYLGVTVCLRFYMIIFGWILNLQNNLVNYAYLNFCSYWYLPLFFIHKKEDHRHAWFQDIGQCPPAQKKNTYIYT